MSNIFNDFVGANKATIIKDGDKVIIKYDAVVSENHGMEAEATHYEIENGNDISDHIINRGKTLTLEGIISDDPITIFQGWGILDRTIAAVTPSIVRSKLSYGLGGGNGKPSKEAFDHLEEIYDRKIPVTIITGLKKYDNMVMENLNIQRSSKTVRSLNFTATFRQVLLVNAVFTNAYEMYQEPEFGAQPQKNVGKLNSKTFPGNTNTSLLYNVKETAVKFFKWLF